MSVPAPGRSGPPLFAVAAFWAFVLGGVAFGVIFVANWRALAARTSDRPGTSTGIMTVGAGPMTLTVPVPVSIGINTGPISLPAKPPEITASLASVVKT